LHIPKLAFKKNQKGRCRKTLLFEGELRCNNGLVSSPQRQETEEEKFLAKAYFLKDNQANSLIPDKYV